MTRLRSPRPKKSEEWVVIAEYSVDADADLVVNVLEGYGVPVVRLPVSPTRPYQVMDYIRVLVPPEREQEARELLGGSS